MTAPRPFAEVVEELRRLCVPGTVIDGHQYIQIRQALPLLLSRLASREAVFEAAVAWDDVRQSVNDDGADSVSLVRRMIEREKDLRAAIEAARALDAATTQGGEG